MWFSRRHRSSSNLPLSRAHPVAPGLPASHARSIARAAIEALESRRLLTADVWSGAGTDTLFTDGANWVGGVAPIAGQDVTFPVGAASTTVTINTAVTVGNVEFDTGYTLPSTSAITVDGDFNVGDATTVISNPIVLGQTITITTNDTAALTLNAISDAGGGFGIIKQGNGLLTLQGTSDTYTGFTTVNGGPLTSVTNLASSDVAVTAGSTFDDNGIVASLGGSGGTYSPVNGAVAGTITVVSNLDLTADSGNTLAFDIDGPTASSQFVVNSGTITLGDATLTGTSLSGYTPAAGDVITLIKNNTGTPIVGTFDNLPEGSTVAIGGEDYQVSYVGGTSGNNVTLTTLQAASSISVTASKTPIYEGDSETFTATVSGISGSTPTGTVKFYANFVPLTDTTTQSQSIALVNGQAQLNTTFLPAGTDEITVVYSGDGGNAAATSAPITVNVRGGTVPVIESSTSLATTHGFTAAASVTAYDESVFDFIDGNTVGLIADVNLTYTWTAVHVPAGAKTPTFNVNGNDAAQDIIARFSKDGGYILQCKVTTTDGNSVYADVKVVVSQKATTLRITPHHAKIPVNGTQRYTTVVLDQFNHPMRIAQTLTYAVTSGSHSGAISASGLFFATDVPGAVTIEIADNLLIGTVGALVV
jgi:autotransporter-associated beta strand protein